MSYRQFSALVMMLVIGGATASAQKTTRPQAPTKTEITSVARQLAPLTASIALRNLGGKFNGSQFTFVLAWATVSAGSGVMMQGDKYSAILVQTPQGIANGNYSVEFQIPWANGPATLSLLRGKTEVAQCVVQQQLSYAPGSLIQQCNSGVISVTDGKLELKLEMKDRPSTQLEVSDVTISLAR